MHELSIAQSIAEAVEIKAVECSAARVKRVRLKIGEASGIVADTLAFCFEMIASQTPLLEGAHLSIDRVPHRAFCRCCAGEFDVKNFIARCPKCGEWSAEVVSGNELEILDMEIETKSSDAL
ncbi:MAG TPA: hydrogenase maturation nickel metallochaperone HypA [Ktedonobacteraceae bacterium]|nr:hydrogenase maturation nickel metallochaperone HypA [Ktedonobacteraceae bacterium]